MAIVTKTRTYVTGDNLPAGYYNADRDELIAGINAIDNSQVTPTAGIFESKLLFNGTSGHAHAGGTSGKKVLVTSLNPAGLTPDSLLKVNSAGTAVTSIAQSGGIHPGDLDFTGMTPGYFLALNGAGNDMETRQILSTDLDPTFLLPEAQVTFDQIAGHEHDGLTSKKVYTLNLDVTGLTTLEFLRVNATGTALETAPGGGGVTNVPRAYTWYVGGAIGTGTMMMTYYVDTNAMTSGAFVHTGTNPFGANLIIHFYINYGLVDERDIGSVTVLTTGYTGSASFTEAINAGELLTAKATQVGSQVPGRNVSITLITATT